jgi:hypothetical protein
MTVEIDGWHELAINPPHAGRNRTDLIVERPVPAGREYRVLIGDGVGLPVVPEGFTPIATVHVPWGADAIVEYNIGDVEPC